MIMTSDFVSTKGKLVNIRKSNKSQPHMSNLLEALRNLYERRAYACPSTETQT